MNEVEEGKRKLEGRGTCFPRSPLIGGQEIK